MLADQLADEIRKEGFQAISQSENNLFSRGDYIPEIKTTPLPHKKVAILSGIGWIGKNNLLVTEEYGSALCMCTVLTDMPLPVDQTEMILPRCGSCELCKKNCPSQVLHGVTWSLNIGRDDIVDVYHCKTCLKCLAQCRYSRQYALK